MTFFKCSSPALEQHSLLCSLPLTLCFSLPRTCSLRRRRGREALLRRIRRAQKMGTSPRKATRSPPCALKTSNKTEATNALHHCKACKERPECWKALPCWEALPPSLSSPLPSIHRHLLIPISREQKLKQIIFSPNRWGNSEDESTSY